MDKCKKGCTDECFELENEEYGLDVKCKNKGIFNLEKNRYQMCIEYTTLDFDSDMGYVYGNLSYIPLTDKPQINYRILQAGNNTYEYLGIQEIIDDITEQDIDFIIYGG